MWGERRCSSSQLYHKARNKQQARWDGLAISVNFHLWNLAIDQPTTRVAPDPFVLYR